MERAEAIRWLEDIHRRFNPTGENLENEGGDVHLQALDMAIKALSAEAEQVTGKLNKPDDSLVRVGPNECKEQKSKLESAADTFCKSQLITCNRVKECNGVCPFEDALKHADKTQTMNGQHTVDHDKDWIIGCIEHDGFIHTHRFDKANQIIHDALSAEAVYKPDYSYEADMARRLKEALSALSLY